MAAYKGEYLLKNPFLGSAMIQRAKAGFAGSSEMLKRQQDLYQGAVQSSARGRTEYLEQIKPEHEAIVDRATEEVDVHGYARAQQQLQIGDTTQRLTTRLGLAQEKGDQARVNRIQGKLSKTVGAPQWEARQQQKAGKLKEKAERSTTKMNEKINMLESSGKASPDKIAQMRAKNLSLQEKAQNKYDETQQETNIAGKAMALHGGVIGAEKFKVRDSANTKNYFFGGSDFTRDVDELSQAEQLEKAWMSSRPGYNSGGTPGDDFRMFQKQDPQGYEEWRKSKGRINQAFSPGITKGYGQEYYKPNKMMRRGEDPLQLQTTGQGLFESGTALAREHLSGARPLWERDTLGKNEFGKQNQYGSIGNWLAGKYT